MDIWEWAEQSMEKWNAKDSSGRVGGERLFQLTMQLAVWLADFGEVTK